MPSTHRPRRVVGMLLFSATLLVLVGCTTERPNGTVKGTVKYKGSPVTTGSVNFYDPAKGAASQGTLDSSGNFTLPGTLEVGTYKVYLQPPIPEQLPPGKAPAKKARFDVPPKYQDPSQTPVKKEVKVGPNEIPIDLE